MGNFIESRDVNSKTLHHTQSGLSKSWVRENILLNYKWSNLYQDKNCRLLEKIK